MLTEKLKNVHRLQGKLMSEHYQRALAAKSEGRPVAYVTAMFPVEIVKAFEPHLATVYPENHAALLIARGQGQLVERAEAAGLDRMGCAYELYNTGYLLEGLGGQDADHLCDEKGRPIPKLAEPDILLACDNQCRVICEWFKHLSEIHENRPYKMIVSLKS
jgi:benzoyl-CoA reductase/2-hydroxyglutaryl-CoA dehydratase subunit BcrC/BadD/HgdB